MRNGGLVQSRADARLAGASEGCRLLLLPDDQDHAVLYQHEATNKSDRVPDSIQISVCVSFGDIHDEPHVVVGCWLQDGERID